jgi:hypothetical protein
MRFMFQQQFSFAFNIWIEVWRVAFMIGIMPQIEDHPWGMWAGYRTKDFVIGSGTHDPRFNRTWQKVICQRS